VCVCGRVEDWELTVHGAEVGGPPGCKADRFSSAVKPSPILAGDDEKYDWIDEPGMI
jgi:hypothetical protein